MWTRRPDKPFNLPTTGTGSAPAIAIIVGAALMIDCSGRGWDAHAGRRAVSGDSARGDLWFPRLKPASGVRLHGGQRRPAAWLQLRGRDAQQRRQLPGRSDIISIVATGSGTAIPILDTTLSPCRVVFRPRASQGGRDHSHTGWSPSLSDVARLRCSGCWPRSRGSALSTLGFFQSIVVRARGGRGISPGWSCSPPTSPGIRVYDDADLLVRQGSFTPIVVEFMYNRSCRRSLCSTLPCRSVITSLPAALRGSRRFLRTSRPSRDRCRSCSPCS